MADRHLPFCSIVDLDASGSFCYRVCRVCESTLPDIAGRPACVSCGSCITGCGSKMLYRLQLSIATEDEVFPVVAFDRAAYKLMGCSADEFSHFASVHPFTVIVAVVASSRPGVVIDVYCTSENVRKIMLGEMVQVTLRPPKNGRAQHMRVVSIVPLAPNFGHVMKALRKIYAQGTGADSSNKLVLEARLNGRP